MSMFLKCDEANIICDKNQYKEAGFWEKLKLNIHLIYCRVCRKYSIRNSKLTNAIKSNYKTISLEDKQALKERLNREISK